MNKEEFIEKAKRVHGDKYDYSKVELKLVKDKVTIICPKHGEFIQEANSHLQGRGCPYCSGKKFSLTDYIEKANKVWNNKYDYSKFEWNGVSTPVCIICPEHGEFWQLPNNHLKGECGCQECRGKSKDFKVIRNFEDFKEAAAKKYGDKFDFSKVEWKGSREKICIICPEHGEFWTLPRQFLLNNEGCPKCFNKIESNSKDFIEICKKNHEIDYDYSKTVYTGILNNIIVTCPKHGDFKILASTFKKGGNCPECNLEKLRLSTKEFIEKAKEVHGDYYSYEKTNYINSSTKLIITCPKHGDFECLPLNHLKGCNCQKCALENRVPSLGELIIENILLQHKIPFKKQFELELPEIARSSNKVIIDFFIKYKGKQYFVEYNGLQHYQYIPFFYPTEEDFQKQLHRDISLRNFCEQHKDKVTLIEIKMIKDRDKDKENIEKTLKSILEL